MIGKPNVGKSLFAVNFAAYLGVKELRMQVAAGDGIVHQQELPIDQARRQLVSHQYHKTLNLQEMAIDVAWGKSTRTLVLMDSVGIAEGIHEQAEIRQAMAATLEQLGKS
ncbi:MAG: GTP-binding protein, partial [Firmicutes bacterium]|nr:GTP-binding protein [Bacillota bacterium]